MGSLKEIKSRIASVSSAKKITSAMKMVSSAKLRKAQNTIENFHPYHDHLFGILNDFLSARDDISSPLAEVRPINRIAIIAISSNSSLCGAFNSNLIRRVKEIADGFTSLVKEGVLVYPIGKKVYEAALKMNNVRVMGKYNEMIDKPNYRGAKELADEIMAMYTNKMVDRVILVNHRFISSASFTLKDQVFLPLNLNVPTSRDNLYLQYYILEPNEDELLNDLLPKMLRTKLYEALLDSNASEQVARTIAMQTASDNADTLLEELKMQYNKSRQQAITSELLDITGAQEAAK